MEVISQLRDQNIVSVLGHCVATHQEHHKGSTIYIDFEYVPYGTLREPLSDWRRKDRLKWPQRMTISMGIARGVHFLHTGIVPGVFGNGLKIENFLLDESLTPNSAITGFPCLLRLVKDYNEHNNKTAPGSLALLAQRCDKWSKPDEG